MKCSFPPLLAGVFGLLCVAMSGPATSSHDLSVTTPSPPYPPDALKAKVSGSGTCEVSFGASGHVGSAVMTQSTGSKSLDENTVEYARKNWLGRPYSRVLVPITYQLNNPSRRAKIVVRITGYRPPYPYQARANGSQGSGMIRVSFDEKGKVTSVVMAQSTGSGLLDSSTVNFVQQNWYSSGGRKTTILVPITYRLR